MSQDSTSEAEKDPYSQWSFQDVFNEDCIVLDPVSVLPVQYEITNCLLPVSRGKIAQIIIYLTSIEDYITLGQSVAFLSAVMLIYSQSCRY